VTRRHAAQIKRKFYAALPDSGQVVAFPQIRRACLGLVGAPAIPKTVSCLENVQRGSVT
jgi:hypothetical protein